MTNHRITRGRRTQTVVADYLRSHGFPGVTTPAASEAGSDVRGIVRRTFNDNAPCPSRVFRGPGCECESVAHADCEVKATAQVDILAALRQSQKRAPDAALNLCIYRARGQGPADVGAWVAAVPLEQFVQLLTEAGWGA